jgi:histidinol-phosphate aminotransferase
LIRDELKGAREYNYEEKESYVRLHLNESPFSPPKKIMEAALNYLYDLNKYPSINLLEELRGEYSNYVGVDRENVIITQGGDGAIKLILSLLIPSNSYVTRLHPTYSMYYIYPSLYGYKELQLDLLEKEDVWELPKEKLTSRSRISSLTIIDDPNNPTGSSMLGGDYEYINKLCKESKGFILIDEAYSEYANYSLVNKIEECQKLLIVRTMSKAFSLAGIRVGYLIANRKVIKYLSKSLTPFEIPTPSIAIALEALKNRHYINEVITYVRNSINYLYNKLTKIYYIKPYKSLTNFILVKDLLGGAFQRLLTNGILVRKTSLGEKYFRFNIGKGEENEKLLRILSDLNEVSNSK